MTNPKRITFMIPAADTFSRLYRRILQLLGRQSVEQAEAGKFSTDLCLARAARRADRYTQMALPESLLHAFSAELLLANDERFIGREEQLNRLLAALDLWRAGQSSMVAVTGPQGCGITSLLQQLIQHVGDDEICQYGKLTRRPYDTSDTLVLLSELVGCTQPIDSIEKLVEYINGLTPRVFAIDNGHFLACRIMGAEEAIRVFGAVMVATQQRHLWVMGCEQFAWRRLGYIYSAERYFSDCIELPLFSETELGQCLTARLRLSGLTLDASTAAGTHEQMPPTLARELPTLYKLSNGKPDIAFFYFLGCLCIHEGNTHLDMQPVVPLDFSILKQLINEELFTLAEVSAHGQLTIDDHSAVFRSSHEESWLLLERLYHRCLLDKVEDTAGIAYCLVPVYSDVVSRYLAKANYLY